MPPNTLSVSISKSVQHNPVQHNIVILSLVALLTGCSANPTTDLTKVAKDWSLTIRASQVIPVYPLTEDIVPGDVFLVQTPIQKQAEVYDQAGFLALDQLVTRLATQETSKKFFNYNNFYAGGYFAGTYSTESGAHPRPGIGSDTTVIAPRAAFPAYSFSINESTGFNLALPLSGVPMALGLLNTSSATGTVTLGDAYTYGMDSESVARAIYKWWNSDINDGKLRRENFAQISARSGEEVYLRVVTRVFITRSLDVTVSNTSSTAAGIQSANPIQLSTSPVAPTPAQPASASAATTATNVTLAAPATGSDSATKSSNAYANSLAALNSSLSPSATPNGSLQFVNASSRSVSMKQTFQRPLVIGYQGFDVKIFSDGKLSTPIPSFTVLSGDIHNEDDGFHSIGLKKDLTSMLHQFNSKPKSQQKIIADKVASTIGGDFKKEYETNLNSGKNTIYESFKQAKDEFLNSPDKTVRAKRREIIYTQLNAAMP